MSCLAVIVRKIGALTVRIVRAVENALIVRRSGCEAGLSVLPVGRMTFTVEPVGRMSLRVGLVCGTNLDIGGGILWASDGRLITLEGGFLITARR